MTQSQDPSCFPPTCVTTINEAGTGYSHSDRQTAWDEPGLGHHSGWRNPAWVDSDNLILSDPSHLPNPDVVVDTISDGPPGMAHTWFSDAVGGNPHTSGGDVSRDKTKLAFVTGENDSTLTLSYVPAFPTTFKDGDAPAETRPHICARYGDPIGGQFHTPTFAPDGGRIAFAVSEGIHVLTVPNFAAVGDCPVDGYADKSTLLIPGGAQPDWGPADVPPARSKPGPGPGPGPSPSPRGKVVVRGGKAKLKAALKRRITVKVAVPGGGRLGAKATKGRKSVATARTRSVQAGRTSLKLTFSRKARAALKRATRVKLTVKVSFTPDGGALQVATTHVTLKR